jgi:hypothetical protein
MQRLQASALAPVWDDVASCICQEALQGRFWYMSPASSKHASLRPRSAALRQHCTACRLLRVTPRPRAWHTVLATSYDAA